MELDTPFLSKVASSASTSTQFFVPSKVVVSLFDIVLPRVAKLFVSTSARALWSFRLKINGWMRVGRGARSGGEQRKSLKIWPPRPCASCDDGVLMMRADAGNTVNFFGHQTIRRKNDDTNAELAELKLCGFHEFVHLGFKFLCTARVQVMLFLDLDGRCPKIHEKAARLQRMTPGSVFIFAIGACPGPLDLGVVC